MPTGKRRGSFSLGECRCRVTINLRCREDRSPFQAQEKTFVVHDLSCLKVARARKGRGIGWKQARSHYLAEGIPIVGVKCKAILVGVTSQPNTATLPGSYVEDNQSIRFEEELDFSCFGLIFGQKILLTVCLPNGLPFDIDI